MIDSPCSVEARGAAAQYEGAACTWGMSLDRWSRASAVLLGGACWCWAPRAARRLQAELQRPLGPEAALPLFGVCGRYLVRRQPFQLCRGRLAALLLQSRPMASKVQLIQAVLRARLLGRLGGVQGPSPGAARGLSSLETCSSSHVAEILVPLRPRSPSLPYP